MKAGEHPTQKVSLGSLRQIRLLWIIEHTDENSDVAPRLLETVCFGVVCLQKHNLAIAFELWGSKITGG